MPEIDWNLPTIVPPTYQPTTNSSHDQCLTKIALLIVNCCIDSTEFHRYIFAKHICHSLQVLLFPATHIHPGVQPCNSQQSFFLHIRSFPLHSLPKASIKVNKNILTNVHLKQVKTLIAQTTPLLSRPRVFRCRSTPRTSILSLQNYSV